MPLRVCSCSDPENFRFAVQVFERCSKRQFYSGLILLLVGSALLIFNFGGLIEGSFSFIVSSAQNLTLPVGALLIVLGFLLCLLSRPKIEQTCSIEHHQPQLKEPLESLSQLRDKFRAKARTPHQDLFENLK